MEAPAVHAPITDRFEPLPLGVVRPTGWLRRQLEANLDGFTGHLDQLAPELVVRDEIYGRDRLTPAVTRKEVGALGVAERDQAQFLWWNSETQSNWWDGYIRTAILLDRPDAIARAKAQVDALLATQDDDGYIGVYAPNLRYQFTGENGELWAKATCLRYLLGWYDYSHDEAVLRAVVRAVDNLMRHYPIGASHPFRTDRPDTSGLTHGLAITDVLEQLARLTGDARYAAYLAFLYEEFSAEPLAEDARLPSLLDAAEPLRGHGVHTYEHVRSVAAAYQLTGDAQLGDALATFLRKVDACLTPAGGPVGDEWVRGHGANATTRGYEYCSLHELLHSYASLLVKSGRRDVGDAAERLFLNAAQGARHPDGMSVAYLKSDNSYAMTGPLNADPAHPTQTRYKYSPVHQDSAVCCVPNAGRIGPYYVQHMWMRDGDALVATLLGPCTVDADVGGHRVRIVEETAYPFGDALRFMIEGARAGMTLRVRRPAWATQLAASAPYAEREGFVQFAIAPRNEPTTVDIVFHPEVVRHHDQNGEAYFTHGALVLAHAWPANERVGKRYPVAGFRDLIYTSPGAPIYECPADAVITPVPDQPLRWTAGLHDPVTKQMALVPLEPMGQTILRQVTFAPVGAATSSVPADRSVS